MRTSLNNIRETEEYLFDILAPVERLIFNARMLVNPLIRRDTYFQKKAYHVIRHYGRKKLREEIGAIETRMFNDGDAGSLQNQISKIFNTR